MVAIRLELPAMGGHGRHLLEEPLKLRQRPLPAAKPQRGSEHPAARAGKQGKTGLVAHPLKTIDRFTWSRNSMVYMTCAVATAASTAY